MPMKHPEKLYLRKSPRSDVCLMCDASDRDQIKQVDIGTQFNMKGWEVPNDPVEGLKILGTSEETKKVWVEIQDPRGFTARIRIERVWTLLKTCRVTNGIILDPCVWMTEGPYAVPMPIQSEEYLDEIKRSYLEDRRVSLRQVERGNLVTLSDGETRIYLGLFRLAYLRRDYTNAAKVFQLGDVTKRYLTLNPETRNLSASSSIDIAEVVDSSSMSLQAVHELANEIPYYKRDWTLSHVNYMAPVKFDAVDLKCQMIVGGLDDKARGTRIMTFFGLPDKEGFLPMTDWRDPRRQFDYIRSLKDPTLMLKLHPHLSADGLLTLEMDAKGQFDIEVADMRTRHSYVEVSVNGEFPWRLSGRLPR